MNTRAELAARLEEILRTAAELPDHEADVAKLHYALTRLSNWTQRTIQYICTMEDKAKDQKGINDDWLF